MLIFSLYHLKLLFVVAWCKMRIFHFVGLVLLSSETARSQRVRSTTPSNQGLDLNPVWTQDDETIMCLNEKGESGYCVLYYLCDTDTRTIITDGTSIINLREKTCPHFLEVCCKLKNRLDTKTTPVIGSTDYRNDVAMDASQMIEPSTLSGPKYSTTTFRPPIPAEVGKCGYSNTALAQFAPTPNADERYYADYGEFPWMVAIITVRDPPSDVWNPDDYLGGGTIIHPSVVMTAAHKVDKLDKMIKCRAGEWDTQTTKEEYKIQDRNVKRKIIHSEYFRTSVYNDVALLILESAFDFNGAPHVGTACLGSAIPSVGKTCFTMGWGKKFNDKKVASVLKKVKMEYLDAAECQEMLRKERLGPFFELHESLSCARGKEGVDVCKGDGGSSLVCPIDEPGGHKRYAVYGMVAYGLSCKNASIPGVYVNVPHLYNWVSEQMSLAGYKLETF